MKARPIELLCIGKLKTAYWIDAFRHYQKMLEKWRQINLREVKDAPGAMPPEKRREDEGRRLLSQIDNGSINIALTDKGKMCDSNGFAALLQNWHNRECRPLCFIIGGPFGLSESVIERCEYKLSLSLMTLPHELARVLLLEQLYRAHSIMAKTGYHH